VPAVAIGIMILPLFDTLRVFLMRALRGKSPFSPDRTHIHHLLIDTGLSHMQATGVLVVVNILFIIMVIALQDIGSAKLLILIAALAIALTAILYFTANRKKLNQQTS
jgi:UDP-GlcNAc:undecaprenyl-phosphate GlcNAc-1-phosphate transferase